MMALKDEPERTLKIVEDAIPQRLEEIRAWAQVGVHGLWLGQWLCSADMISEADYLKFVFPYDQLIVDAVASAGMKSIYHFCGDVIPRLKHIEKINPAIFGVEESKKGFEIDIGDVRETLPDVVCLLGNIDVYDIVEQGAPDVWAREVERQIRSAGPERFIVSCGSPITFDTPPQWLRDYVLTAKDVRDRFH
jgi:uroporphyrinogen-III decarboxylase